MNLIKTPSFCQEKAAKHSNKFLKPKPISAAYVVEYYQKTKKKTEDAGNMLRLSTRNDLLSKSDVHLENEQGDL